MKQRKKKRHGFFAAFLCLCILFTLLGISDIILVVEAAGQESCAEQGYTEGVADTTTLANAVLTPEQLEFADNGETIENKIDEKDISDKVPKQDKEVIENGIEEFQTEEAGHKCSLCHTCSTFLGICYFVWLAFIVVLFLIIWLPFGERTERRSNKKNRFS